METEKYEYRLPYSAAEFIADLLPPGSAVLLNALLAAANRSLGSFCNCLLFFCGLVFGIVFLYETAESLVTGSDRRIRMEICGCACLIRYGCRLYYFRRSDLRAVDFDPRRHRLTFILKCCLEKRRGICSYTRLFSGKSPDARLPDAYLSPLRRVFPDDLSLGPGPGISPDSVRRIVRDGTFAVSVPCFEKETAAGIIGRILGADAPVGGLL